jgi:hypothetical protein
MTPSYFFPTIRHTQTRYHQNFIINTVILRQVDAKPFQSRSGVFGAQSNPLGKTCRLLSIDSLSLGNLAERNIPNWKSDEESKFLENLANCRIVSIGSGVDVISYDGKRGVCVESLSPGLLFARPFYPTCSKQSEKTKGRFSSEIRELASLFFSTITLPEL